MNTTKNQEECCYSEYIEIEDGDNNILNVSNTCAICLSPYEQGDCIVYSPRHPSKDGKHDNVLVPYCRHVFHMDCMLAWLMRKGSEATCPICRNQFLKDTVCINASESVISSET